MSERDRVRNPYSFAKTYNWLTYSDLSIHAKAVYTAIRANIDENNLPKGAWPTKKAISLRASIKSETTVDRAITELVDRGLLTKTSQRDRRGFNAPNKYHFIEPTQELIDELIAPYFEAMGIDQDEATQPTPGDGVRTPADEVRTPGDDGLYPRRWGTYPHEMGSCTPGDGVQVPQETGSNKTHHKNHEKNQANKIQVQTHCEPDGSRPRQQTDSQPELQEKRGAGGAAADFSDLRERLEQDKPAGSEPLENSTTGQTLEGKTATGPVTDIRERLDGCPKDLAKTPDLTENVAPLKTQDQQAEVVEKEQAYRPHIPGDGGFVTDGFRPPDLCTCSECTRHRMREVINA